MLLEKRQFLVKERVAFAKLTDVYDIVDADSGQQIGIAREEPPSWAKYLRLLVNKGFLPTFVKVYEHEGMPPILVLHKGPSFLRSTVTVLDGQSIEVGSFRSKLFSLGGGFFVYDTMGQQVAEVKGDWKGWNFKLLAADGKELGVVTKKWAGAAKELFTSADNYVIALSDDIAQGSNTPSLLLAAGLAIDLVFKEKQ
jgi:uncharacterized protein YxjI